MLSPDATLAVVREAIDRYEPVNAPANASPIVLYAWTEARLALSSVLTELLLADLESRLP